MEITDPNEINPDSVKYEVIDESNIERVIAEHKDIIEFNQNQKEYSNNVNEIISISDEVLSQMTDNSMISEEEAIKLRKAQVFLLSTYTQVPQFRPRVNKLSSVLSDATCPSWDSKYWQCKAEAEVHFKELQRETFKFRRALVDLKEIEYKIHSIKSLLNQDIVPSEKQFDPDLIKFDLERLNIKRDHYEFELKQLEKTMKYRVEELIDWHEISQNIEDMCEYSTIDCYEHMPDTHYKKLVYRLKTAKNEEEQKIFAAQLKAFHSIVGSEKAKEYAEDKITKKLLEKYKEEN